MTVPVNPPAKPVVLVVDDAPINLQIATGLLRESYQALAATSGEKALEILARRPDVGLVLLDVMMPGMDGYETCRRIKAEPATAQIPVVFLSALESGEDRRKAVEAGAVAFVNKPFEPEELMRRVREHLRSS